MKLRMPPKVAERIVKRSAADQIAVVVPSNGRPSRVFALEKYLKMRELPKATKPWKHRKSGHDPDPLGRVPGTVRGPLRRRDIYR